jgi:DNA-binding Lrp family transcriptional regulator
MDITLEKIDVIRERTGVTYKQAKEALDRNNGDVVEAIIELEEGTKAKQGKWTETVNVAGSEVIDRIKELVKQGNVTKVRIKKDDSVILDIPVTAGAIGTLLAPQLAAIGAVVAVLSKATLEIERPNKEIINVSDMVGKKAEKAIEFIDELADDAREFFEERRKKPPKDDGGQAGDKA